MEYVNFGQICQRITFKQLLDYLNIPYSTRKKGELKGEGFIVSLDKNQYFNPLNDTEKGSVINFYATHKGLSPRDAALELRHIFLPPDHKERPIPNLKLTYCKFLEEQGISEETALEYEVGLCKQQSIMGGKIAFKVYGPDGLLAGYIGYNPAENKWHYPSGFKRPLYNYNRVLNDFQEVLVTANPFHCLYLLGLGFKNSLSLLAQSMTDDQELHLTDYRKIVLIHPWPDNIILRLKHVCFLKAPIIINPLKTYSANEVSAFFA